MNKKSLISMLVSLCLVGVIGLGATFAYLSTTTGTLTNTFTVGNVNGTLLEEVPDGTDEDLDNDIVTAGVSDPSGYEYQNLLPGQTIVKAPYINIALGSANAVAYIKVTGLDALVALQDEEDTFAFSVNNFGGANWTRISGLGAYDGIYRYNTTLVAGTTISTAKLFTGITFDSDVEGATLGTAIDNIELKGCLVQADSIAVGDTPDTVAAAKLQP